MSHPNVELMSLIVRDEQRRVRETPVPVEIPERPGRIRQMVGKSLIAMGEQVGGHQVRRSTSPVAPALPHPRSA